MATPSKDEMTHIRDVLKEVMVNLLHKQKKITRDEKQAMIAGLKK